jgi:hypothetical protein
LAAHPTKKESMQSPQKPLTPLSTADFSSPYDLLKKENADLRRALATTANAATTLDLQLRSTAYRKFIIAQGLMAEFKRLNPSM